MTCIECNSIFLRPAEPAWLSEGDRQWARRFACGECGAVFVLRATRIGTTPTDREKREARHNPPPKVMLDNGGTTK